MSIFAKTTLSSVIFGLFLLTIFATVFYQNLNFTIYLLILFTVAFIVLFSVSKAKTISQPVEKLKKILKEVGKGGSKVKIDLKTHDEFEELSHSISQIIDDLEKNRLLVKKTKEDVGVQVEEKTRELEEIIKSLERKLKDRVKEIQEQIYEYEKLQKLTVSRELKMIELKKAIQKFQR